MNRYRERARAVLWGKIMNLLADSSLIIALRSNSNKKLWIRAAQRMVCSKLISVRIVVRRTNSLILENFRSGAPQFYMLNNLRRLLAYKSLYNRLWRICISCAFKPVLVWSGIQKSYLRIMTWRIVSCVYRWLPTSIRWYENCLFIIVSNLHILTGSEPYTKQKSYGERQACLVKWVDDCVLLYWMKWLLKKA